MKTFNSVKNVLLFTIVFVGAGYMFPVISHAQNTTLPTVTVTLSPTTVFENSSSAVLVKWDSTNATTCKGVGPVTAGVIGASGTTGSQTVYVSSAPMNLTATISCDGPGGTSTGSAMLTVVPTTGVPPIVTFSSDKSSVLMGATKSEPFTLSWTTDAASCMAFGYDHSYGTAWLNSVNSPRSIATNGSQTLYLANESGMTYTRDFSISCKSAGGKETIKTVSVSSTNPTTVVNTDPPVITLSADPASVNVGDSSTLSWSTTKATACVATSNPVLATWSSSTIPLSGSRTIGPLSTAGSYVFKLTCAGDGGSSVASATITVGGGTGNGNAQCLGGATTWGCTRPPLTPVPPVTSNSPAPETPDDSTVSLSASPSVVALGDFVTLTWSSTNATRCSARGSWYGAKKVSGTEKLRVSLQGTRTYGLKCTGDNGSASTKVQVKVEGKKSVIVPQSPVSSTASSQPLKKKKPIEHNLKLGSRDTREDDDVARLQEFLKKLGYLNTASTGYYGPMTEKAVKKYQEDHNIPPVGTVGPVTRREIDHDNNNKGPSGVGNGGGGLTSTSTVQVNLRASDSTISSGGSVTLTWSTVNATTCSASAIPANSQWSGAVGTSGTRTINSLSTSANNEFDLSCVGTGVNPGGAYVVVQVSGGTQGTSLLPAWDNYGNVSPQAAQPLVGSDMLVSYKVVNATSCTATGTFNGGPWTDGVWSGSKPLSTGLIGAEKPNTVVTFKTAGEYELALNCAGPAGTSRLHLGNILVRSIANAPTLNITYAPQKILASKQSDPDHAPNPSRILMNYMATNATGCTFDGPNGNIGTSGTSTELFSAGDPILGGYYYRGFACWGSTWNDQIYKFFEFPTEEVGPMTVSLSATPSTVAPDAKWSIKWDSTGATSCTADGNYWGNTPINTSGTMEFNGGGYGSAGTTKDFGITCFGPGRKIHKTATITFTSGTTAPTVVSVSTPHVPVGGTATISWDLSSTTYPNCVASVNGPYAAETGWTGTKTGKGSMTTGPLTHDDAYVFGINCNGQFATSDAVTVGNTTQLAPATLNMNPQQVAVGQQSYLSWGNPTAFPWITSCTAYDQWSGVKGATGTETITAPSTPGRYTYTMACTPSGGTPQRGTQNSMVLNVLQQL